MLDQYKRKINYLRISVTDRCNFRCKYCMPPEGVPRMRHVDILRFKEIVEVVQIAVNKGVNKIRITGGEPLIRKGIIELITMIGNIKGIKDFGITTNGVFLTKYAEQLANAGVNRVNISLDTLDPERFKKITRLGNIDDVLNGIEAAKKAGLTPIKINCVIKKTQTEIDAVSVAEFCKSNNLSVRFIREMNLEKGLFWKVKGGTGGECKICNRLRLSSDGKIRPCLFSELEYDVRKLGAGKALELALQNKPLNGTANKKGKFSSIGG